MRKVLGAVLILAGLAALGLSGFGYWQCFVVDDSDLSESRELRRQAAEDVQRRARQRGKALGELIKGPSREQIAADPDKAERTVREAQEFLKEWDDILR